MSSFMEKLVQGAFVIALVGAPSAAGYLIYKESGLDGKPSVFKRPLKLENYFDNDYKITTYSGTYELNDEKTLTDLRSLADKIGLNPDFMNESDLSKLLNDIDNASNDNKKIIMSKEIETIKKSYENNNYRFE